MQNTFVPLMDVVKVAGAVLVPFVLWGVKKLVKGQDEIRQELKGYVNEKQCEVHRELFQLQIDTINKSLERIGKRR